MSDCKVLLISSQFPPGAGGASAVYFYLARHLGAGMAALAPKLHYGNLRPIAGWQESDNQFSGPVERIDLLRAPIIGKRPLWVPEPAWSLYWHIRWDRPIRKRALAAALRLVEKLQPEAICVGDLFSLGWLGLELRARRSLPILHYLHGDEISTWTPSPQLAAEAAKALTAAEGIVAVSSFCARKAAERGAPSERIRVILNGIDLDRFYPLDPSGAFLDRYDLRGKSVLATIARLESRKGIDTVIRALPAIRQAVPNAIYLVVGGGNQRGAFERLAADLNVTEHVRFCGSVPYADPTLIDFYRACDLFLHPNREMPGGEAEGLGLVFLEAGACGKPVIGGRSGGVPEVVTHEENGLLVDGHSVEQTAAAAIRILSDPALARRMGEAGLARARRSGWNTTAERFREFCAEVALRNRAPVAAGGL